MLHKTAGVNTIEEHSFYWESVVPPEGKLYTRRRHYIITEELSRYDRRFSGTGVEFKVQRDLRSTPTSELTHGERLF